MELSSGRLQANPRIEEGRFGESREERRKNTLRHHRDESALASADDAASTAEAGESHLLDDMF